MDMNEYARKVTGTPAMIANEHRENVKRMALKYINQD
jgi:hypothetical protein